MKRRTFLRALAAGLASTAIGIQPKLLGNLDAPLRWQFIESTPMMGLDQYFKLWLQATRDAAAAHTLGALWWGGAWIRMTHLHDLTHAEVGALVDADRKERYGR